MELMAEVPTEAPDSPDWRLSAACRDTDVDMVPEQDARGEPAVDAALAVCEACPVTEACLAEALAWGPSLYGVWGNTTRAERIELLRGHPGPPQRRAPYEAERTADPGVGHRVREARVGIGMSQSDLARGAAVAPCTLSRLEAGKRAQSQRLYGLVGRVAHALGVDPEELLYSSSPSESSTGGASLAVHELVDSGHGGASSGFGAE